MTDPAGMEAMMSMMKGNMAMIVPQTLIMSWINAFFSGYVVCTSLTHFPGLWITLANYPCSEVTFSPDNKVQINAAVWSCD